MTDPPPLQSGAVIQVRDTHGRLSQRETDAVLRRLAADYPDAGALERHLAIEQAVAGSPLYTGNRVRILRDGPETFAALCRAIRDAGHALYLEYYILQDVACDHGRLSDLLIAQRRRGVRIGILYDSVGSLTTPGKFFERLRSAGIEVRAFNPIDPLRLHFSWNDRDHRKLLIADGDRAIIGGVNLSTDYQNLPMPFALAGSTAGAGATTGSRPVWHDTDLQIDGPAVADLTELFEQHWRAQGGPADALAATPASIAPAGDQVVRIIGSHGGVLRPPYYGTLLAAIRSATSRIWITASYFVPTRQENQALVRAARRGVDVRLLLPARSDSGPALAVQQSHYAQLLRAGVKIYEREDGILHSKSVVADGVWSIVGSSNFDQRSILFNDELDAVVIGADTAARLEEYFESDLQHAQPVDPAVWRRRGWARKLRERFWRIWEQLL